MRTTSARVAVDDVCYPLHLGKFNTLLLSIDAITELGCLTKACCRVVMTSLNSLCGFRRRIHWKMSDLVIALCCFCKVLACRLNVHEVTHAMSSKWPDHIFLYYCSSRHGYNIITGTSLAWGWYVNLSPPTYPQHCHYHPLQLLRHRWESFSISSRHVHWSRF